MSDDKVNLRETPEVVSALAGFLAAANAVNALLDLDDEFKAAQARCPEVNLVPGRLAEVARGLPRASGHQGSNPLSSL